MRIIFEGLVWSCWVDYETYEEFIVSFRTAHCTAAEYVSLKGSREHVKLLAECISVLNSPQEFSEKQEHMMLTFLLALFIENPSDVSSEDGETIFPVYMEYAPHVEH